MNRLSGLVKSVRAFKEGLAHSLPDAVPEAVLKEPRPRLGLALGGGFARGMAHIGVLRALEEEHIPIDFLAGTSVGAVVAAMYASGVSVKEMSEIAALVRFKDFARWTVSRFGFCSNDRMAPFLAKLIKCKTFEELRVPLAVAATDFITGDPVIFQSGSLVDAIRASCAYPGMFLPVSVNGRLLVDGLLAHPVPAAPLRQMGAERVLGVYLSAHWVNGGGPRHIFDVIGQCFSIAQDKMCHVWKADADLVIEPNIQGVGYDAFERAPELVAAGEASTRAAMADIKRWFEAPAPAPVTLKKPDRPKLTAAPAPAPATAIPGGT